MSSKKSKFKQEQYRIIKNCLIVLKIIHDGKQVQSADLAETLNVSRHTVYRYLNVLRGVGYKIEYNQEAKSYEIVNSENVDLSYII